MLFLIILSYSLRAGRNIFKKIFQLNGQASPLAYFNKYTPVISWKRDNRAFLHTQGSLYH